MRWSTRRVGVVLLGGGACGGVLLYATRRGSTHNKSPPPLSADEFNALQNKELLVEAFHTNHLPWNASFERKGNGNKKNDSNSKGGRNFSLTLYRLLGCPYCAKVEWVLRYYSVPFIMVDVDTLSGAGIPDSRYSLVPQIRLSLTDDELHDTKSLDTTTGAYVVDSQKIISALSVPLGFAEQLKEPRVVETCRWITERFQAVSFVATNITWRNAFASYPYVTPPRYHNIVFRMVGASALCILSRYKILPHLLAREPEMTRQFPAKDPAAWLERELAAFIERFQNDPSRTFHGGNKPDIADLEMYAVTRVVDAHPRLRHVLQQGAIGEWNAAMDAEVRRRTHLET